MDWSLITGRGWAKKNGTGCKSSFTPIYTKKKKEKKRGGGGSFGVVFTQELEVLVILKREGAQQVSTLKRGLISFTLS